jgi:FixJ family two-component response regulator
MIVYVIDDDASVRKAFARLMASADLDCETFSSPEEFLAGPREERNACIVADVRMPGSTGFDLQQKLMEHKMRLQVIVVSASDDAQVREHTHEMGAIAFFRKPVDDQTLLDAILSALSPSG